MKTGLRLSEYVEILLKKRKVEERKIDPIHERGDKFTSPAGNTSTEEIRILNEYMEQVNIQKLTIGAPEQKKNLLLKKFFKMKRNQQVEIFYQDGKGVVSTIGKASAIGRDFVMLTDLKERIWYPYHAIVSANIPYGVPTYSNSHQYFIYDNNLRNKLVSKFGQTVSKRDALIQQFYEETLQTHLRSWAGTWVKVETSEGDFTGKINDVYGKTIKVSFFGKTKEINIEQVHCVRSLRLFSLLSIFTKKLFNKW